MMITGYADAGRILENQDWIGRAEQAAQFILTHMQTSSGKLLRTWRDGRGGSEAFLIDYSALIHGLLAIYQANHSSESLRQAIQVYDKAKSLFYVEDEGWYDTEEGQSDLFVRTRALSDGAMPAATSLILLDQIGLAQATQESRFLTDAMVTLDSESQLINATPLAAVVATKGLQTMLTAFPEKFDEEFDVTMANPSPVRMSCEPSTLTIPKGGSAQLAVKLRFANGWHVNSNMPGNEYAVPLSFKSLDENVSISMSWPESESLVSAGEQVEVFGGSVLIPITVSANAIASGQISMTVTWQACNADSCLESETSRIPCTIVVE